MTKKLNEELSREWSKEDVQKILYEMNTLVETVANKYGLTRFETLINLSTLSAARVYSADECERFIDIFIGQIDGLLASYVQKIGVTH